MRLLWTMTTAAFAMLCGLSASAATWTEGQHYFRVQPAQLTLAGPGKVEVAEAFSYGCPACNQFLPIMEEIEKQLPSQAQVVLVHASFNTAEQWPMFQRAFYTAQQLGLVAKTHESMFTAIWGGGPLAVVDGSGRIKKPAPTIEDAARWYAQKTGVDAQKFVETSKSFAVDSNIRRAEAWMKACRVDSTPTLVINGKYRLTVRSAGGVQQTIELIDWLVARELAATTAAR
ncbi:MAG TPA: thiol:disulfide interchange protein DsbA/DsbL [Povalibacter sp.]|uniref:thiol:disulfide interchange protein DsbA/DsbL n=1 Tax=Povalibacter sp. TaxID=1962978 RepID=UPI002B741EA0|nr:thiol:disulfide interchange protein DsbA/DsbL [Povalibacter sp.]HMN43887.1 thiol:disulfide interchange protein DsbA/DsbL [Povalibacter sp.]